MSTPAANTRSRAALRTTADPSTDPPAADDEQHASALPDLVSLSMHEKRSLLARLQADLCLAEAQAPPAPESEPIQALPGIPSDAKAMLAKLVPYRGQRDPLVVNDFTWQLERIADILDMAGWPFDRIMNQLSSLFTGAAAAWFRQVLPECASIGGFLHKFRWEFVPANATAQAQTALSKLKHRTGAIDEYTDTFYSLVVLLPELNEFGRCVLYRQGLTQEVVVELDRMAGSMNLERLSALVQAAHLADSIAVRSAALSRPSSAPGPAHSSRRAGAAPPPARQSRSGNNKCYGCGRSDASSKYRAPDNTVFAFQPKFPQLLYLRTN